jgi:type 1 fimbriae regulatory protein FimB/type 1 fimbriae regulatory protein FimE
LNPLTKEAILVKVDALGSLIYMAEPVLRVVAPDTVMVNVAERERGGRPANAQLRTREYLTESEIARLLVACGENRYSHRDRTMILLAYRHGLRVSELCNLQWTQVDFDSGTLAVNRVKKGSPATHPLTGRELRALRRLQREAEGKSPFVFVTERGGPMTRNNFQRLVYKVARLAGLEITVHPHMLRHACGFALANKGTDTRTLQAYLGHKNIQHTVRYTELAPNRFRDLWKD